jgi:hypothetical protein
MKPSAIIHPNQHGSDLKESVSACIKAASLNINNHW